MRDGMGEGKNPQGDAPNPGGKGAGREHASHATHNLLEKLQMSTNVKYF